VLDHAASSEEEFKPDSDKSDNNDDDDDDGELSVVESTSGSSVEESDVETPEKVASYWLITRPNIFNVTLCGLIVLCSRPQDEDVGHLLIVLSVCSRPQDKDAGHLTMSRPQIPLEVSDIVYTDLDSYDSCLTSAQTLRSSVNSQQIG